MCSQNKGKVCNESSTSATAAEPQVRPWQAHGKDCHIFFITDTWPVEKNYIQGCAAILNTVAGLIRLQADLHQLQQGPTLVMPPVGVTHSATYAQLWKALGCFFRTKRVTSKVFVFKNVFCCQTKNSVSWGSLFRALLSFRRNLGNQRIRTPRSSLGWFPSLFMTSRRPSQK